MYSAFAACEKWRWICTDFNGRGGELLSFLCVLWPAAQWVLERLFDWFFFRGMTFVCPKSAEKQQSCSIKGSLNPNNFDVCICTAANIFRSVYIQRTWIIFVWTARWSPCYCNGRPVPLQSNCISLTHIYKIMNLFQRPNEAAACFFCTHHCCLSQLLFKSSQCLHGLPYE